MLPGLAATAFNSSGIQVLCQPIQLPDHNQFTWDSAACCRDRRLFESEVGCWNEPLRPYPAATVAPIKSSRPNDRRSGLISHLRL